jgi:hypothetical protein
MPGFEKPTGSLVPRAPSSCRWSTLHSVLILHGSKPGAALSDGSGFLLLATMRVPSYNDVQPLKRSRVASCGIRQRVQVGERGLAHLYVCANKVPRATPTTTAKRALAFDVGKEPQARLVFRPRGDSCRVSACSQPWETCYRFDLADHAWMSLMNCSAPQRGARSNDHAASHGPAALSTGVLERRHPSAGALRPSVVARAGPNNKANEKHGIGAASCQPSSATGVL